MGSFLPSNGRISAHFDKIHLTFRNMNMLKTDFMTSSLMNSFAD